MALWGSPEPVISEQVEYTVVGFYGYDGTRFCAQINAVTPRAAEDAAVLQHGSQTAPDGSPCELQICAVLAIEDAVIVRCDDATFLDPDKIPADS